VHKPPERHLRTRQDGPVGHCNLERLDLAAAQQRELGRCDQLLQCVRGPLDRFFVRVVLALHDRELRRQRDGLAIARVLDGPRHRDEGETATLTEGHMDRHLVSVLVRGLPVGGLHQDVATAAFPGAVDVDRRRPWAVGLLRETEDAFVRPRGLREALDLTGDRGASDVEPLGFGGIQNGADGAEGDGVGVGAGHRSTRMPLVKRGSKT